MSGPDSPKQKPEGSTGFKEKFESTLKDLKSNEKIDNLVSYATANTRDTVSYVVLIVGIILLFFSSFYGGLLVGLVAGFYFSSEIMSIVKNFNALVEDQGVVKSLIAGGLLLAVFITAPWIVIGVALAVAVRQILFPEGR
ncbi:MAG: hypothetical protein ACK5MA_09860 [Parachlamydiaceae bacterium]